MRHARRGPPSSSGVTSSPSTSFTTPTPVSPKNVSFGWMTKLPWRGRVGAAAGIEAEHAHDARHDAADPAQRGERLGVAVEAADAGGDECAGAVVQADERYALFRGQLVQGGQLPAVGGVHRTRATGEIVAIDSDIPPAGLDQGGDQRGAVEVRTPVLEQDPWARRRRGRGSAPIPSCAPWRAGAKYCDSRPPGKACPAGTRACRSDCSYVPAWSPAAPSP